MPVESALRSRSASARHRIHVHTSCFYHLVGSARLQSSDLQLLYLGSEDQATEKSALTWTVVMLVAMGLRLIASGVLSNKWL